MSYRIVGLRPTSKPHTWVFAIASPPFLFCYWTYIEAHDEKQACVMAPSDKRGRRVARMFGRTARSLLRELAVNVKYWRSIHGHEHEDVEV